MGKTLGVLSLKGGVGKTSVVLSLGTALAFFGKKVLLVDGNFSAPNLGLHLNIIEPDSTMHHVFNKEANISDAVYELDYFDVLPSAIFNRSAINPFKLKDKIKTIKKNYDYILIDSSPNLNDETLAVMNASDEILVITTPDIPTLGMTIKALKVAKQKGVNINGLIINKVHNKNFELSIEDIETSSGVPVLAVIPYDINNLKAVSKFTPYTQFRPYSSGSEEYKRLAATLSGNKYKPLKLRTFFSWVNPPKQEVNRTIFYKSVFEE
jgi:septum site-determining protein MinD